MRGVFSGVEILRRTLSKDAMLQKIEKIWRRFNMRISMLLVMLVVMALPFRASTQSKALLLQDLR
jgi:hypothetical protein